MKKIGFEFLIISILTGCTSSYPTSQITSIATLASASTLVATPTSLPAVYLSQLTPDYIAVGGDSFGVGVYPAGEPSIEGKPIQSHGNKYPQGLFAHAPSQVDYQLEGDFRLLKTDILIQDSCSVGDGAIFRVLLDDLPVFISEPVLSSSIPQKVELDISRARKLSLVVDMRSNMDCDWAIWGNPYLVPAANVSMNYPTATSAPIPTISPNLPCISPSDNDFFVFLNCADIIQMRENMKNKENRWMLNRLDILTSDFLKGLENPNDPSVWGVSGASDLNHWLLFGGIDSPTRQLALEYLLTGDRIYSEAIVKIIQLLTQSDNGGIILPIEQITDPFLSLVFAYSVVRNTDLLTDSDMAFYDNFFFIQTNRILRLSYPDDWQSLWNPGIRNVAMVATVALYFQKDTRFEYLYQQAKNSIFGRISTLVNGEGGYKELSDNYSPVVLNSVVLYAEAEYKNGNDIYSKQIGETSIHEMCRWFIYEMTPEGTLPAINDGWFESYSPGIFRLCGNRTNDPELIFAADKFSDGQKNGFKYYPQGSWMNPDSIFDQIVWNVSSLSPKEPDYTSILLPQSGLAILRDGWEQKSQYLLMMFTPTTHHEHYSFGNINVYDQIPWIIENGYQFDPGKATKDHSTILIDGSNQSLWRGTPLAFFDQGNSGFFSVISTPYSDFKQTRSVLWYKPLHQWIIIDDGEAKKPHSLSLLWFVLGTPTSTNNNEWIFKQTPGSLHLVFLPNLVMDYSLIERSYIEGKSPGTSKGVAASAEVSQWPVHLATLITTNELLSSTRMDDQNGFTIFSSFAGDKSLEWVYSYQPDKAIEFLNSSILGKVGCVSWESNNLIGYCFYQGNSFSSNNVDLVMSEKPVSVDVNLSSGNINLESTGAGSIRLYWPGNISALVSKDNHQVPFTWENEFLQFEIGTDDHSFTATP